MNSLTNVIKNNICFKGQSSCINLFVTYYHDLIHTILRANICEAEPILVNYEGYNEITIGPFKSDLTAAVKNSSLDYRDSDNIFTVILNCYALKKRKWIVENQKPSMN